MTGKTHMIGGVVACQAMDTIVFSGAHGWVYYAAGLVGAVLPDICHTHSKIGRRFPVLSKTIATIFGHRTFTHSLLFLLLASIVLRWLFPENDAVQTGVLIGIASHYLLDALTVRGIRFFYPANIRVRIAWIRTGSWLETVVLVALTIAMGWFYWGPV
ncbi:metal-dependent hydrolase [Shouchella clausii]|uniref:metal-dependent hydrolase n=1 Tax=Shouchella clausii TaxID=79880 RepID=UPI000BA684C1|nr:metal-dependent hydrolase [Shouchella clausii]PAD93177.1 hypothetical protein CHH52_06430 [Shouchella clausii]